MRFAHASLALSALIASFATACGGSTTPANGSSAGGSASSTGGAGGDTGTTGGAGGAGGNAGGAPWMPGGPVTTFTPAFVPIMVNPGKEDTQCITFRLDNPETVNIRRFSTELTEGTHHIILYKSKATTESKTPTPCAGLSGILKGEHPLFIAQQKHSVLEMPTAEDGTPVALEIEPNQMVRMEMHFINTGPVPLSVTGKLDLDTVPAATTVTKGDLAFWGTQNIHIPPNSAFDTGVKFQPALPGTKSFAVTTHQHHLGTRMQVWFATWGPGDLGMQVADNSSWSDPKLFMHTPPLSFDPDTHTGLAYQCQWQNPTDQMVTFGESANDEMCFLWHYYYPSQGFQVCFDGACAVK
jgi:hypothetical protein